MRRQAQKNDSVPASLDLLILRTLSVRDLNGYAIVQFIRQSSDNELLAEEGSLYPALQRLQLNGWIDGVWGVAANHRRARIYNVTAAGRRQLHTITFHPYNLRVEHAPLANLKGVKSRLLVGCVVTGVAFGQQSAHNAPPDTIPVNLCMEPAQELPISITRAKSLVAYIFAQVGVNLTWHTRLSDCDGSTWTAFKIRWTADAPFTSGAGALAAAHPFGASAASITIYEVPLQRFLGQYGNAPEVVLAYVLAHELAHVMQGLDRHSDSGILKASWSYSDYYRMLSGALTFTAKDMELIRAGLETKRSNTAIRERAPQIRSTSSSELSSRR